MAFSSLYGNITLGEAGEGTGIYGYSSFRQEGYNASPSPDFYSRRPTVVDESEGVVDAAVLNLYNMNDTDGTRNREENFLASAGGASPGTGASGETGATTSAKPSVQNTTTPAQDDAENVTFEDVDSAHGFFSAGRGEASPELPARPVKQNARDTNGVQMHNGQHGTQQYQQQQRDQMYGRGGTRASGTQPQSQSQARGCGGGRGPGGGGYGMGGPMLNFNYGYMTNMPMNAPNGVQQGATRSRSVGGGGGAARVNAPGTSAPVSNTYGAGAGLADASSSSSASFPRQGTQSAQPPPHGMASGGQPAASRVVPFGGPAPFMVGRGMPYGPYPTAPRAAAARERRLSGQSGRPIGGRVAQGAGVPAMCGPQGTRGHHGLNGPAPQGTTAQRRPQGQQQHQQQQQQQQRSGSARSLNQSGRGSMASLPSSRSGSQYGYAYETYQAGGAGSGSGYNDMGYPPNGMAYGAPSTYGLMGMNMGMGAAGRGNGSYRQDGGGMRGAMPPMIDNNGSYTGMMSASSFSQQQGAAATTGASFTRSNGLAAGSRRRDDVAHDSSMYMNGNGDADPTASNTGIAKRRQFRVTPLSTVDLTSPMDPEDF